MELIRPQGGIVCIEATDQPMPMAEMKTKAASLHWEYMFARALHQTPDNDRAASSAQSGGG